MRRKIKTSLEVLPNVRYYIKYKEGFHNADDEN